MKRLLFVAVAMCVALLAQGKDIKITKFRHAGPYAVQMPIVIDSLGVDSKPFKAESMLDAPLRLDLVKGGQVVDTIVERHSAATALHLLGFQVQTVGYAKAKVNVRGLKHQQLFVDGKQLKDKEVSLLPGTHDVVVKYLTQEAGRDTVAVTLSSDADLSTLLAGEGKRVVTINDFDNGLRIGTLNLSYDGRYCITSYSETLSTGKTSWRYRVSEMKTGRLVEETDKAIRWMPRSCRYYYTQTSETGRCIVTVDPATGSVNTFADGLSNDPFVIAPTEQFLILTHRNEGPKDDKDVHQYQEPDDRQPGWRDRNSLTYYDVATGMVRPLTFGNRSVGLMDISDDGRYLLVMTSRSRLTQRPTTLMSILRIDLQTMTSETLVEDDGFLESAQFSPDGRMLAVKASPESFGGIGKNLPEGRTPSMFDYQLYLFDIASHKVTPMTRTFNPSIENYQWNRFDGQIYFTALDRDYIHLFRANPSSLKVNRIDVPEDAVRRFSMAGLQPLMVWSGVSASNSTRSYQTNLRSLRHTLIEDQHQRLYADFEFGECQAWDFVNSRGDTICGRYVVPPHFDASKKYPMLVYYYGGCSPTSRSFEGRYAPHMYAAQGYVVYTINPSGAAGFGQEYASRHVNTAGDYVADDIIEGTKRFAAEHAFIDSKHIGCFGASYGGFMTQYLQTKTDIFAAAMSHAGISDHTSYWGEGYWGYSYSETSMANSYPWTRKDLYVDHSPLYNADKIHTPILFMHGTADTNVPVGESIQMYTALKLLGRPTAFVVVEGENHWIQDYHKRIKWQSTIFAWFQKWLKGDSSWWDSMYKTMPQNQD